MSPSAPTHARVEPRPASVWRPARARRARGFTLVELLVAATAGLVVAAAAFMLSKNAMTLFQHEARISTAQLGTQLGMTRLTADIMRAGFMASADLPNVNNPDRCGAAPAPFDNGDTFRFQAARIYEAGSTGLACCPGASAPQSEDPLNNLLPDAIDLVGNFHTSEMFPVAAIDPNGLVLYLQIRTGPMFRTMKELLASGTATEAEYDALMAELFPAGRMLRLIDDVGKEAYSVVLSADAVGGGGANPPDQMVVTLDGGFPLPTRAVEGTCGLSGFGTGLVINPVARIRYELRSLVGDPTGPYFPLVKGLSADQDLLSGDAGRVELVRVEKDVDNADMSIELVSEYATDLQFGVTAACSAAALPCNPDNGAPPFPVRLQIGGALDAQIPTIGASRMRSIHVRFSTRTRAPDRTQNLGPAEPDGRPQYFFIPGVPGAAGRYEYARMRTLYAEIALPNLFGVTW